MSTDIVSLSFYRFLVINPSLERQCGEHFQQNNWKKIQKKKSKNFKKFQNKRNQKISKTQKNIISHKII